MNTLHSGIDKIFIVKENSVALPSDMVNHPKIHVVSFSQRPTFNDIMNLINQYSYPDDINIMSNTDICFDQTINMIRSLRFNEALALTRWDVSLDISSLTYNNISNHSKRFDVSVSFDTWIVRGKIPAPVLGKAGFSFGIPGCDNAITYILYHYGKYNIYNPSINIHSFHVHSSQIRHYTEQQRINGPGCNVKPCAWR